MIGLKMIRQKCRRMHRSLMRHRGVYKRFRRLSKKQLKLGGILSAFLLVVVLGSKAMGAGQEEDVYASAEGETAAMEAPQAFPPPGIHGAISGVQHSHITDQAVERIGTSCEDVIVGQRTKAIEAVPMMDGSAALAEQVQELKTYAAEKCGSSAIMSDNDYATLLSIVEAEAGGEDIKGRILVANVIMNRVASDRFPDTVYDVVWESTNGVAQFSPTEDGRIGTVTVSEGTVKAVQSAIEGTDYSQGALFFVAKEQANQDHVKWFESDLEFLFEHGVHTFYTYSDL